MKVAIALDLDTADLTQIAHAVDYARHQEAPWWWERAAITIIDTLPELSERCATCDGTGGCSRCYGTGLRSYLRLVVTPDGQLDLYAGHGGNQGRIATSAGLDGAHLSQFLVDQLLVDAGRPLVIDDRRTP